MMRIRNTFLVMVMVSVFFVTMFTPRQVSSAGLITVNTKDDEYKADGDCSLREAIIAATENRVADKCAAGSPEGTDTIVIDPSITEIIIERTKASGDNPLWYGDLNIVSNIMIIGNPNGRTRIIKGLNMGERLFVVGAKEDLGDFPGTPTVPAALTLQNLFIGMPVGATAVRGGGVMVYGGSTFNSENNVFFKNDYSNGGAIFTAKGSTIKINDTTFDSNVGLAGGAILNKGVMTITNSNFSGNLATTAGGAIYHNSQTEALTITNVTFDGNTVTGSSDENEFSEGAAIYSDGFQINIINSTFVGNSGGKNLGATLFMAGSGTIRNSLIFQAGAVGVTCKYNLVGQVKFTSMGFNLEDQNNCFTGATGVPAPAEGDKANVDPATILVKSEAGFVAHYDDGSITKMFKLAKDMNTAKNCPAYDQRSVFHARSANACDSGSYEFGAVKTVNNTYLPAVMKK